MDTVKLEDFVREALVELARGVAGAQAQLQETGACVNPPARQGNRTDADWVELADVLVPVQSVKFDVAVTALAGKETGGKVGVGVLAGVLNLGAEGHSTAQNTTVTRLQFDVRLALPPGPGSKPMLLSQARAEQRRPV